MKGRNNKEHPPLGRAQINEKDYQLEEKRMVTIEHFMNGSAPPAFAWHSSGSGCIILAQKRYWSYFDVAPNQAATHEWTPKKAPLLGTHAQKASSLIFTRALWEPVSQTHALRGRNMPRPVDSCAFFLSAVSRSYG